MEIIYESMTATEATEALRVIVQQMKDRPYFGPSGEEPEVFQAEERAYVALLGRLEKLAKSPTLLKALGQKARGLPE